MSVMPLSPQDVTIVDPCGCTVISSHGYESHSQCIMNMAAMLSGVLVIEETIGLVGVAI